MGRMSIVATVTDPLAMRLPAFSISACVEQFVIERPDSASFVGEVVSVSAVNEITLTQTPSNRSCLVSERWVPSAVEQSNQELIDRAKRLQALVAEMRSKGVFARAA